MRDTTRETADALEALSLLELLFELTTTNLGVANGGEIPDREQQHALTAHAEAASRKQHRTLGSIGGAHARLEGFHEICFSNFLCKPDPILGTLPVSIECAPCLLEGPRGPAEDTLDCAIRLQQGVIAQAHEQKCIGTLVEN